MPDIAAEHPQHNHIELLHVKRWTVAGISANGFVSRCT
jgi:hypothetical protein